ncbi:hypothetical protein ACHAXH_005473 [Discostella pseudostelligera]
MFASSSSSSSFDNVTINTFVVSVAGSSFTS